MSDNLREMKESPVPQGEDEKITYYFTSTPYGSSPSNASMVVKDDNGDDVTDDVTSGSMGGSGDVITLKQIEDLTAGIRYRVEIKFSAGGGAPFKPFFFIDCEE